MASDVVLDGNWVESVQCGYQVSGRRVLLVNNNADQTGTGIRVTGGDDVRVFQNNVLRAAHEALVLGDQVRAALVLNNVLQGDERNLVLAAAGRVPSGPTTISTRGPCSRFNSRAPRATVASRA